MGDPAAGGSGPADEALARRLLRSPAPTGVRAMVTPVLPSGMRGARVQVRRTAVWGFAVLVVVLLALVGVRSWMVQQGSVPVPLAHVESETAWPAEVAAGEGTSTPETAGPVQQGGGAVQGPGATGDDPAEAPVEPEVTDVLVHVTGAVRQPGVVSLESGDRVRDAVQAAGGLSTDADAIRVNLARPVADGEWIWVPVRGEEPPELVSAVPAPAPHGEAGGAGTGTADGGADTLLIDLNTADQATLEQLPGVGPKTAQSILTWRAEHGAFSAPEELLEIRGIGPRTLEELRPHLRW